MHLEPRSAWAVRVFNRVRPEQFPGSLSRRPGTRYPRLRQLIPRAPCARPARSPSSAELGQRHFTEGSSGAERLRRPRPSARLCSTQLRCCGAPFSGAAAAARTPLPAPWAGLCPGPAVPASSAMCLRTSSSGTNFTCRERRLLRVPSGRLMAASVTWARPRRRGALPPRGADRPRLTPHGAAPAGPGSAPRTPGRGGGGRRWNRVHVPASGAPRQPTRAPRLE